MQIYRVRGRFKQKIYLHTFTQELLAPSKERALERVYSDFGSRNGLKRNQINIDEVVEIKPEEVTNPKTLAMLE